MFVTELYHLPAEHEGIGSHLLVAALYQVPEHEVMGSHVFVPTL
jgi:hypothetical protein